MEKKVTENEYKFLVSNQIFHDTLSVVQKECKLIAAITQINYYYDDSQLSLNANRITIRVRQIGDKLLLQEKHHKTSNSFFVVSQETEKTIAALPNFIFCENENIMARIKGSLVTQRKSFFVDNGIRIDFDENWYLGICDYEIELEFSKAVSDDVYQWVDSLHLVKGVGVVGKSTRFFDQLRRLKLYE